MVHRYETDGALPLLIAGHVFRTTPIHRASLVTADSTELKHYPHLLREGVAAVLHSLLAGATR